VVLAIDVIQSSKWRETDVLGVVFLMQYLQNQEKKKLLWELSKV